MKSYRQVLLSRVPEGQRTSARALFQAHGLSLPSSLSALIQNLEAGTPTPTPPPPPPPPTPTRPHIDATVFFTTGELHELRTSGRGFTPNQAVRLQITTRVDDDEPTVRSEEPTAKADGTIDHKLGVSCPSGRDTVFRVQATDLFTSKQSNEDGDSC
jgi:hypothetical protein